MMNKNRSAKHFDNCKEFHENTRPEKIEALCLEIYRELHPNTKKAPSFEENGEVRSWLYSLPDFAELLFDPETYRQKTVDEGNRLLESLDSKIDTLEAFSSSSPLLDLIQSQACSDMLTHSSVSGINKAVDLDTITALNELENSLSILKEGRLTGITESLKKQKEDLTKALTMLDEEELCAGLDKLEIDIEYPVLDAGTNAEKRIDVLLSRPDLKRYAIIELKQWTEDSIRVSFSGEGNGTECLVSVTPGNRSQIHPALKVRDVYKKALKEQLNDAEAEIRCFVYLHNQMYNDSQLFRVSRDMQINIYDDCAWPNNIMYTKLWHGRLLNRLTI